jgi:type VI secretion system protein ImpA
MKTAIDIDTVLAPLPGDSPVGEDLRYTEVYAEIKEARKAEDDFAMGEWQHETKSADWSAVLSRTVDALTTRSKDLQIAAWLAEALVELEDFEGLAAGFKILQGLIENFWETAYPKMEDGDIEYRLAPFEFLNERLSTCIRQAAVTSSGYSWFRWQESRDVGYEADTKNKFGDGDETKKQRRDELVAEGKITAEQFDAAVVQTPRQMRSALTAQLASCQEAFAALDKRVDEKFGRDAPRISDIGQALEECARLVGRVYGEQKASPSGQKPLPDPEVVPQGAKRETAAVSESFATPIVPQSPAGLPLLGRAGPIAANSELTEYELWEEALRTLDGGGIRNALERLLTASCSMPSERERTRYRFMIAKLCIKADRHDLARPIVEGLSALIEELHLERWESPLWIAEVLEALYQCLTYGEPSDEDLAKAQELFKRLCTLDVTKALGHGR